jgi:leucyl-tRNA synthetase
MIGGKETVFDNSWPAYDESALQRENIIMVIQINGKLRGSFSVNADITEDELFEIASNDNKIASHLDGREIVKKIFIPGKLLNIVVR